MSVWLAAYPCRLATGLFSLATAGLVARHAGPLSPWLYVAMLAATIAATLSSSVMFVARYVRCGAVLPQGGCSLCPAHGLLGCRVSSTSVAPRASQIAEASPRRFVMPCPRKLTLKRHSSRIAGRADGLLQSGERPVHWRHRRGSLQWPSIPCACPGKHVQTHSARPCGTTVLRCSRGPGCPITARSRRPLLDPPPARFAPCSLRPLLAPPGVARDLLRCRIWPSHARLSVPFQALT